MQRSDPTAGSTPESRKGQEPRRATGWAQTFEALRYRNYRLLWTSTLLISGGNWLQQVTLGWLAYELTRSPLQVGIIMGLRTLPLLLSPLTGVLADRFERRLILLIDQAVLVVLAVGFASLLLFGEPEPWHLYVFAVAVGLAWATNNPVRQALVANSVPKTSLMNAVALNSVAFNLMRTVGPAVGGAFIVAFGPGVNFMLQAFLYILVFALMIPFRPVYATADREEARSAPILRSMGEGFRYVAHEPTTLIVTAVTLLMTLTMMSFVMNQLPVYAAEVLGARGGNVLGLLLMSMGIGGFTGTILMARFGNYERKGLIMIFGVVGAGLAILALALASVLWQAMAALIVQQAFIMVVMTTNNTIVQTITPDAIRGRVIGVYMMEIGMIPIGGVAAGAIASRFGVETAFVVGATAGLVAIGLFAAFVPRLRQLRL
ncbi:MAG: MFS transporter [Chloroflexi bacterium]|nr:MFS transporter [Chloroflexota bacterium]